MSDRRRSNPEERERISSMTRDEVIEYCGKLGSDGPWCHRKSLAGKLMDHDAAQRATIEQLHKSNTYLGETIGKWENICQEQQVKIDQQATEIEQLKSDLAVYIFQKSNGIEAQNQALREALDWNGPKVSNNELEQVLKYLGPTGNRAEAQIKASVEHLIYMRSKAQAALQEES